MTSKAKAKGYGYERELVSALKEFGCTSVQRAFGSDGRAIGFFFYCLAITKVNGGQ